MTATPPSMRPDAIGLPSTLYLYRDRVRLVAGRFSAKHVRQFEPGGRSILPERRDRCIESRFSIAVGTRPFNPERMPRWTIVFLLAGLAFCGVDGAPAGVARPWTPPPLSSDAYESSPAFTPDGREMYFMRANRRFDNYRILWSRCGPAGWSVPAEVPFAAAHGVLEADPFVTADGRRLYFVSTRADPKREDLDIWAVTRLPSGSWSAPERLPAPVNSTRPELLPRLTNDGRLYFGSSRDGGYGQGDIYVGTADDDGSWTVANVGPPVSTPAFEYEAEISRNGRHLVVVADRGDRSHLYRFQSVDGRWSEIGRVPANDAGFQVGPLLSPLADRLLFAQDAGVRSGEIFLLDLVPNPMTDWPPRCEGR